MSDKNANNLSDGSGEPPDPDALRLLPPSGLTRDDLDRDLSGYSDGRLPLPDTDRKKIEERRRGRGHWQFSVFELIFLTTVACFGFALSTWLPVGIYAGLLGVVTLVCLFGSARLLAESRLAGLTWWAICLLYVGAAVSAVVMR